MKATGKRFFTNAMTGHLMAWSILLGTLWPARALAQETVVVGIPTGAENALEFVIRSDQDGAVLTHYGYLTHIFGLADEALFSDPTIRTEATAHFTFWATTTLTARQELGNLIITTALGTLTIYFNDTPGGDFNNPASFTRGRPIATYSVRHHNVLTVLAPNEGITLGVAELAQLSAESFALNAGSHRLGRPGLGARLQASGQGRRTQVEPLKAFVLLGAHVIVTER
ncbi:MAG: hypothetical protein HY314_07530 [Acidobacteria bacterium]|nr:hypothetical protein [Acidobacteriota bacterium]